MGRDGKGRDGDPNLEIKKGRDGMGMEIEGTLRDAGRDAEGRRRGRGRHRNLSHPGTQRTGMRNSLFVPGRKGMGIEIENSFRDGDPFFGPVPSLPIPGLNILEYTAVNLLNAHSCDDSCTFPEILSFFMISNEF